MYGQISDFGRYFKKKESFIDNRTFQFHYRVTFGILIASSAIMMMSNLYGGPPIQVREFCPEMRLSYLYCKPPQTSPPPAEDTVFGFF